MAFRIFVSIAITKNFATKKAKNNKQIKRRLKKMKDYNHIGIIGRLTKDPVLTEVGESKTKVLKFTVAVNRYKEDSADFIPVSVWDKGAEALTFLRKGMRVCVDGRLEIDQLKEQINGEDRYRTFPSIRANNVQCLEKKAESEPAINQPTTVSNLAI
jgi:single stranded DNA-binding protein